ncbi:hypothetical protein FRC17_008062 [Serendipita sp. 399]|nr:hypothetical protein FRC17_008062 [Serendipita sp. 399]
MDTSSLFSAAGTVAVVTGGATGIGLMIAKALEWNGAEKVYIIGRRSDVLANAAKQAKFGRIDPVVGDVTSKAQLQSIAERVQREVGRVDVLVNCAGVMSEKHRQLPMDSLEALQEALWGEDPEKWNQQFNVNVTGAFFTTVAFLRLLKSSNEYWDTNNESSEIQVARARRTSQVITVTGIAAHHRAQLRFAGYAASKAASLHLMKTLSTVLSPFDIRFNMLAPGIFPTEMTAGKGTMDEHNQNYLGPLPPSEVPQRRPGDEQDIAGAILYLCGRSGWYCNGVEVIVDGGRLSISPSTY